MRVMHLLRSLVLAVSVLVVSAIHAQGTFTINGRVKVDGGTLDGTRVVVYKNGAKDRVLSSNLARFELDLDLNSDYMLSFEKDGFVTKKISFNTHAPAEAAANGFTPFEFAVSLFKQYDDVNMVIFNQPVGMIRYDATADDFDYDTDYTKSIQSQLQKALDEVAKKQKEEADASANVEKLKAEEARSKAKAEEVAKKAAAQRAADEAKAKKEQEAVAAKAEADRKRTEAEAAKAEQQRQAADAKKAEEEKRTAAATAKAEAERLAQEARRSEEDRKKADAARREEERKADLAKKEEEKPVPPPPPPVARKEAPKPAPKPPPPQRNTLRAGVMEGEDGRRSVGPVEGAEESRMRDAKASSSEEERPELEEAASDVKRDEELIVEKNQVITVIRLATDREKAEYRKVVHKYGATFYFKNGEAISRDLYEQEALAETR